MAKIIFNGQEYDSVEAMPAEVRQLYQMASAMFADQDQDGVPDMFENLTGATSGTVHQTMQFIVDGKSYASLDELPAEARQKYEQAIGRMDANRDGVPDVFAGGVFSPAAQPPAAPSAVPVNQQPHVKVIGESGLALSPKWLLIGVLVALVLVAAFLLLGR
jgi:hypothetical protein